MPEPSLHSKPESACAFGNVCAVISKVDVGMCAKVVIRMACLRIFDSLINRCQSIPPAPDVDDQCSHLEVGVCSEHRRDIVSGVDHNLDLRVVSNREPTTYSRIGVRFMS